MVRRKVEGGSGSLSGSGSGSQVGGSEATQLHATAALLTTQITRAAHSWQALENLWREWGGSMNAVHLSAWLVRAVRLAPPRHNVHAHAQFTRCVVLNNPIVDVYKAW
jgi:hypothetical protein